MRAHARNFEEMRCEGRHVCISPTPQSPKVETTRSLLQGKLHKTLQSVTYMYMYSVPCNGSYHCRKYTQVPLSLTAAEICVATSSSISRYIIPYNFIATWLAALQGKLHKTLHSVTFAVDKSVARQIA